MPNYEDYGWENEGDRRRQQVADLRRRAMIIEDGGIPSENRPEPIKDPWSVRLSPGHGYIEK